MTPNCTSILLKAIKKKSVAVFSNYSLLKSYNKIEFPENKKLLILIIKINY